MALQSPNEPINIIVMQDFCSKFAYKKSSQKKQVIQVFNSLAIATKALNRNTPARKL